MGCSSTKNSGDTKVALVPVLSDPAILYPVYAKLFELSLTSTPGPGNSLVVNAPMDFLYHLPYKDHQDYHPSTKHYHVDEFG